MTVRHRLPLLSAACGLAAILLGCVAEAHATAPGTGIRPVTHTTRWESGADWGPAPPR